jgi:hypothetical protein
MSMISSEIVSLENKYWKAMRENDVETAVLLTRFPCVVMSPAGVQKIDETEYREMMKSHDASEFRNAEITNPQVEAFNDDVAMISYSTKANGMTMLDVSTWIRQDGEWRCGFHSESPQSAPKGSA